MVAFFICKTASAQSVTDMRSLLKEMTDYSAMAKWPQPAYTEMQASSYDRASISPGMPGWFANADASQYIRTEVNNGRQEHVMMDADGPGTIVRFWLTTFRRNGNLRIYLDNGKKPALTIPAYDLMKSGLKAGPALLAPHSSYEPKEKGGSTLYLPIPYARHCKITWEDKDTDNQPRYYQINYRTYARNCKVKTFTKEQMIQLKSLINTTNHKLLQPDTEMTGEVIQTAKDINSNDHLTIHLPNSQHMVKMLIIQLNLAYQDSVVNKLMISMTFDGRQTVYCPLADFAGSGSGIRPLQSWYRTITADGRIFIRWVMPYKRGASVSLINLSGTKINSGVKVITGKWHWDKNSMYFHASWKKENNIPVRKTEKDGPIEWNFLTVKGRGIFLGDTYAVDNQMHSWYGEGDQKLWADESEFPSEYGTGTEDYYNTSWAPVVIYQTPFANAPRADNKDSYGQNTFTRTRNLDRVPFKRSFKYNIEMLGWENGSINASAVTYWYGNEQAHNISQ